MNGLALFLHCLSVIFLNVPWQLKRYSLSWSTSRSVISDVFGQIQIHFILCNEKYELQSHHHFRVSFAPVVAYRFAVCVLMQGYWSIKIPDNTNNPPLCSAFCLEFTVSDIDSVNPTCVCTCSSAHSCSLVCTEVPVKVTFNCWIHNYISFLLFAHTQVFISHGCDW